MEPTSNAPRPVRSIRSLGIFGAAAIAISIGVSLGVYDLLGLFIVNFGRKATVLPYLLMIVVALPIIATYAERAAITPGANGAYALARNGKWPMLTYFSGWLLMGGYAAVMALLAWGAGFHLELGLGLFNFEPAVPDWGWGLVVIGVIAAGNALGFTRRWSRRARMVTTAVVLVVILALRGLFAEATIPAASVIFSTQAPILRMTLLTSASLWGVILLLGVRNELSGRRRAMRTSMLTGVLTTGLLGALAALTIAAYNGALSHRYAPLLTFVDSRGFFPSPLLEVLYIALGFAVNFFAIDRVLIDSLHLFDGMTDDGFLPKGVQRLRSDGGALGWPLLFVVLLAGLMLYRLSPLTLTGLAAATFFWSTALIHLPDLFNIANSRMARRTRLPFHPLFPALTIAISVLLPFNLARSEFWPILIWILAGLFLYSAYARRHNQALRQDDVVVEEEPFDSYLDEVRNAILVALTDNQSALDLIIAGLQLARGRDCTLFVMRVLQVPEQTAEERKRQLAQRALASLDELIATAQAEMLATIAVTEPELEPEPVPARSLVRIGLDLTNGILEAASAKSVEMLLVNWSGKLDPDEPIADARINRLMRDAECDIAVLHGKMPATLNKVVVSVAGGPHARYAAVLADSLVDVAPDANLRLVYILTPGSEQDERKAAMQMIETAIEGLNGDGAIEYEQVRAANVRAGLLAEADAADLLMVGAYRDYFFRRSQFRGIATHVAAASSTPTLIVRAHEQMRFVFLARLWELISDPLPALTSERRAVVSDLMRAAARSSVDFYVLIILSAVIASLGLLQNSPAVIIGAMLVAPLMSPILAMAMGMANGEPEMFTGGAEVTAKGVAMAIFVGAVVSILSPMTAPTNEILARTSPNLLDLMVALASGAAAGYAVSRSEVAAALPGVAIAAALVPPLCVVGYGLGTSELTYATGAMLLFTTNLVAIIFAAALVFVALGFHARGADFAKIGRGVRLTIVSLLAIIAVLVLTTVVTVRDANRRVAVEEVFQKPNIANKLSVQEIDVRREDGVYKIEATIIALDGGGLSTDELDQLEAELSQAVGGEAELVAIMLAGVHFDSIGYEVRLQATTLFTEAIEEAGGRVLDHMVTGGRFNVIVDATVVEGAPGSLDDQFLATLQQELTDAVGMPATLRITALAGEYKEVSPTLVGN